MQDVEINEQADVIISEWMGYMLLYEVITTLFSMLEYIMEAYFQHYLNYTPYVRIIDIFSCFKASNRSMPL